MASNSEPWNLSHDELQQWFQDEVEDGSKDFATECNESMDDLVRFLHGEAGINVKEIRKGGSIEKGTFYKDGSDLDCVVILNDIPPLNEYISGTRTLGQSRFPTGKYRQSKLRPLVIKAVSALRRASFVTSCEKKSNVQVKVNARQKDGGTLEIDVLFTGDNLAYEDGETMERQLVTSYNLMLEMKCKGQRFIYQPCLTPLQTKFVKSQPGNVKSLIRLVKYWKAEYLHQMSTEKLISSYALELITIYVYEEVMGSPDRFDLGEGFKRVMGFLASGQKKKRRKKKKKADDDGQMNGLKHFFDDYYSDEMAERGMELQDMMKKSILLDPADPTDNVFQRWKKKLPRVRQIAQQTLQTHLLLSIHV